MDMILFVLFWLGLSFVTELLFECPVEKKWDKRKTEQRLRSGGDSLNNGLIWFYDGNDL